MNNFFMLCAEYSITASLTYNVMTNSVTIEVTGLDCTYKRKTYPVNEIREDLLMAELYDYLRL